MFSRKNVVATILVLILPCLAASAFAQTVESSRIFSASNTTQAVSVQQGSSGFALKAISPSTGPVAAIFGKTTAASGFNNGIWGQNFSTQGVGVRGEAKALSGPATGGAFFTSSSAGTGMRGAATASSGNTFGVVGGATSPNGTGVFGSACSSATTCNGNGVVGVTCSGRQDCTGAGGEGIAGAIGNATLASAGLFITNDLGGASILVGQSGSSNVFRVDPQGKVYADGGFSTGGADFAESVAVSGKHSAYMAGDVLVIDHSGKRQLALAQEPYSTLVAGIYSTKPGIVASPNRVANYQSNASNVPLAIVGIVPAKVTTENGAIQPGDLLVTSSKPGYAMKGTDRSRMIGAVVGKAMEPLTKGDGAIQVLVTLQ